MSEDFQGRKRLEVFGNSSPLAQRFIITGADSGNGTYPGKVGTVLEVSGASWKIKMEWNNQVDSGWRESDVQRTVGSVSPIVLADFLRADDNYPAQQDHDYDDLKIQVTDLDAVFDVVQRPFAADRGTLTMLPDGIFDVSQGVQYMGVRIRNRWEFDWTPSDGMMIGISPVSIAEMRSQGIQLLNAWTARELEGVQQEMQNGFVKVPNLAVDEERVIYFKVDCSQAGPGKPEIAFVAQRDPAWDAAYDEPTRQVRRKIFVSKSTYDPAKRELVAEIPEGTIYMRLLHVVIDGEGMNATVGDAMRERCERQPPPVGQRGGERDPKEARCQLALQKLLQLSLETGRVDPCLLRKLLDECCEEKPCDCGGGGGGGEPGGGGDGSGGGGMGGGPGGDDWCRFRPFFWLPIDFEYRIVPTQPYPGKFGPLAFDDPWWKVVLVIVAVLLAAASIIYDYFKASSRPEFIIGTIAKKSGRTTSNVDAALIALNGSRGLNLAVRNADDHDDSNHDVIDGQLGVDVIINRSHSVILTGGGTTIDMRATIMPRIGMVLFKSGCRTGTTMGLVDDASYNGTVDGISYTGQVGIVPLHGVDGPPVGKSGDSGSLWIDSASRRVAALNFAGNDNDDGQHAIACPMLSALTNLGARFEP